VTTRRVSVAAALGFVALALGACQSTQDISARRAREATTKLDAKGSTVRTLNAGVRVEQAAVVQDAVGTAAVVRLRNLKSESQVQLPVSIVVRDAQGKSLYRNDVAGLDPSLVSLSALDADGQAVWVNNQIPAAVGSSRARTVEVRVGDPAHTSRGPLPRIAISALRVGRDDDGTFAKGLLTNTSKVAQRRLSVACVALRGSKVVAAGRAVVDQLGPVGGKPVGFTAFLTGRPAGAPVRCSAAPTVLTPGAK
jgi:hypothetical protein